MLAGKSVLIVGAGGLGSPAAYQLAAAGVGRICLCDADLVDLSNLQRQILHFSPDVGQPKVMSGAAKLRALNPAVVVEEYRGRLTAANARELFAPYDVVLDCSDNFATRYLVNDACVLLGKPQVHGSIFQFDGQVTVFQPGAGPCYRCVYPQPPAPGSVPSCAMAGVIGVLPGLVGSVMAMEAVKLLTGQGAPLVGRLVIYNALDMEFAEVRIRHDPACPICGEAPSICELIDYEAFCGGDGL
ncbi:MAG: putative molybdopterin biosynthesis protein [Symbiobacteriaceae bacterium]|jgi:adenylyltransferase/sulfurtransferase|nr:putative molybdopterin biosynthesis protein [Symbiobacteriaceae bacterium]